MKNKHQEILQKIFENPVHSGIIWREIETMLEALGATITERRGSRVCIALNKTRAVFHRPHPRKEADKGAVIAMRKFLLATGVKPC
jgi:hypothetical protein